MIKKAHDYDPESDYDIDRRPDKNLAQAVKITVKRIKKDLLPSIKEFDNFTTAFIKNNPCLGTYVTGTHSSPYILLNLKDIKEACKEYKIDYSIAIETTITHELAHAIQDARGIPSDEEEAEDFAYQYQNDLPLNLIRRK